MLAPIALVLAIALVTVGWIDHVSARREFGALVRAQAASVRDTVAAAARANRQAAIDAQTQLGERLLDNARLLVELDRAHRLTPALLEGVALRNHLFRVSVFAAGGAREHFIAPAGSGPGPGRGGPGWSAGGAGGGPGAGQILERILAEQQVEAVTDLHAGRRADVARLAAGVRRATGGAVIVSVDAGDVRDLQQQASLDRLLDDIVRNTGDVAYLVYEQGDIRRARGTLPEAGNRPDTSDNGTDAITERELQVSGRPVLEVTGPIALGGGERAHLHLGMWLDGVRRAEGRTLARLVTSLGAASALGIVAIGLLWLYRDYGALSVEHARAQQELRRRDRLAAMGELASTVAHEIRNPLNAIAMSAQRLELEWLAEGSHPGDLDDARALVRVVHGESQRIERKVREFLDYARPPKLDVRPTAVAPWVERIAGALDAYAASRQVTISRGPLADAVVAFDAEQLGQALDNLIRNAVEASPPDAVVSVAARVTAGRLQIEVADAGGGIASEHLPKIFDLYFTTKAGGTGVGLAVTQQIASAHDGRLDVESVPGAGTTIRLVLPARDIPHA